jgi:hypothetical protein
MKEQVYGKVRGTELFTCGGQRPRKTKPVSFSGLGNLT